jgi:hypothetical protein
MMDVLTSDVMVRFYCGFAVGCALVAAGIGRLFGVAL